LKVGCVADEPTITTAKFKVNFSQSYHEMSRYTNMIGLFQMENNAIERICVASSSLDYFS